MAAIRSCDFLPCPFCKNKPRVTQLFINGKPKYPGAWTLFCNHCSLELTLPPATLLKVWNKFASAEYLSLKDVINLLNLTDDYIDWLKQAEEDKKKSQQKKSVSDWLFK